jgi:hypothetical protein
METPKPVSAFATIARLIWLFLGPGVLFLTAYTIYQNDEPWSSPLSVAFLLGLGLLIVFRQADPLDSYGEPRPAGLVTGYAVGTVVIGLVAWMLAHWL